MTVRGPYERGLGSVPTVSLYSFIIRFADVWLSIWFSSHEAFTRAFKGTYGITPSEYRKDPKPVVLRTKINPFDRYFLGLGEIGMIKSTDNVKVYFVASLKIESLQIKLKLFFPCANQRNV
jgi:hypothetical protein